MNTMPLPNMTLATELLNENEYALFLSILSSRGKNKGALRASKPKVEYTTYWKLYTIKGEAFKREMRKPTAETGYTAYLWRMVAFMVSPVSQHQCMPTMAFCDIPETGEEKRAKEKELDELSSKIVDLFPTKHGVNRWAKALS